MTNEIAKLEQLARDPETPQAVREAALRAAAGLLGLVVEIEKARRGVTL